MRFTVVAMSVLTSLAFCASNTLRAQNLNPFDQDSEIRSGFRRLDPSDRDSQTRGLLRKIDPSQLLRNRPTRFYGGGRTIPRHWTTIQNLGNSDFYGHFLDIEGDDGSVILFDKTGQHASGTYWSVVRDGTHNDIPAYTIRNLGKSDYYNYYLDIDGKTGKVILSRKREAGANWLVSKAGTIEGVDGYVIRNLATSPYKGWYLDIDGREGTLMLTKKPVDGIYWYLAHPPR